MAYPENPEFIVFSEFDSANNDLTLCLDSICQRRRWSTIAEAIQAISHAITTTIEKRHETVQDEDDMSAWEVDSEFEELDPMEFEPMELSTADNNEQPATFDDLVFPIHATAISHIKQSLRRAQNAGAIVGIYPRHGTNIPEVVSISARATCLGVANSVLEAWGLKETDNLVLLIRFAASYPSLTELQELPSGQATLQFRFGKCLGEKPSTASVQCAYRDRKHFTQSNECIPMEDGTRQPFELIHMSNSLDKLLNCDFFRLLKIRRRRRVSWEQAQRILSQLELVSAAGGPNTDTVDEVIPGPGFEEVALPSLIGPLAADGAMDEADLFSMPLVSMQLALHRLANCTHYCMVCNGRLNQGSQALKPYVCSNPLCLFQYLSLGLGSSIEHEIINAPYVVDMLISFLYSALATADASRTKQLPDGLQIKTPYVDDKWAQTNHAAAEVDMEKQKLRGIDLSTLKDDKTGEIRGEKLQEGDRVVIIHTQPETNTHYSLVDITYKSWCRLTSCINGEWAFEKLHEVQATKSRYVVGDLMPMDASVENEDDAKEWYPAQIFGYWQNIDELNLQQRCLGLMNILDGLPSVLDMRAYLLAQPGRRLTTWTRINSSELSVLNWVVASNRSLIVQDDKVPHPQGMVPGQMLPEQMAAAQAAGHLVPGQVVPGPAAPVPLAWNKVDMLQDTGFWMQFRFLQGSPEREQAFETIASEMQKSTETPTMFTWHGSSLRNWHSIIRTGLDFETTANGRSFGNGVYFSSDMNTSLGYSGGSRYTAIGTSTIITDWPKSHLRINSAIAICELIKKPDEFVSKNPHYVVDKLDWIQCRYLILRMCPTAEAINFPFYEPPSQDKAEYVRQDPKYNILAGPARKTTKIPITAIPLGRRAAQTETPKAVEMYTKHLVSAPGPAPTLHRQFPYDEDDVEYYLGDNARINRPSTAKRSAMSSPGSPRSPPGSGKRARTESGASAMASMMRQIDLKKSYDFDPSALKMESLRLLDAPAWASTSREALRRLTMDMRDLHERQSVAGDLSAGYYVHSPNEANLFQWIVELFTFDPALPLARDLHELRLPTVVLEFRFGPSYPLAPPFVRVVRPQLVPFAEGGGGHVTVGGALCLELLTGSGWTPAMTMDNIVVQIQAALSETERPARVNRRCVGVDYGVGEAAAAFARLAGAHGWVVPADFQLVAYQN